jgi:predicted membrane chloride channel (bestrophin family)
MLYTWMAVMPFILEVDCGNATPMIIFLVSLGFFGLDEVAEILESPFGK